MIPTNQSTVSSLIRPMRVDLSDQGRKYPSAFIPFCSLGGNMSAGLGRETEGFAHPTCASFTETILDGNLCYEIDPSQFEGRLSDLNLLGF